MQVQAEEIHRALLARGVNAEMFDWTAKMPADIYHFVGLPTYLSTVVQLVWHAGKPYVCTVMSDGMHHPLRRMKARVKFAIERRMRDGSGYEGALRHASAIIAITPRGALGLDRLYGLPPERVLVINHGIDARFTTAKPDQWRKTFGTTPFILCVGAIQKRKNQLLLAEACNRIKLPLVLLGPVHRGELAYGRDVTLAMSINAERFGGLWLQDLDNDNPLLVSAFAACRMLTLLSAHETQPLSVLQAMAMRKPILLGDAEYCNNIPFKGITRVAIHRHEQVEAGLQETWDHGTPSVLPSGFIWEAVASTLQELYERILASPLPGIPDLGWRPK